MILDLPISVNHQYRNAYVKGRAIKILSPKAKEWVNANSPKIKNWIFENNWQTVDEKLIVYLWFYYKDNRKRDCHNFFKMLFDQLEQDGLVENDKYIIPRVVDYVVDRNNPRVEMTFKVVEDEQSNE